MECRCYSYNNLIADYCCDEGGVILRIILSVLFTLVLLTACTNHTETTNNNYKFRGETDHWEAEYAYSGTEVREIVDGRTTYSNEDNYTFELTYKGSIHELSTVKNLEYSFNSSGGSGWHTIEFTEPPSTLTFTSKGGSKGGAKTNLDDTVQVKVTWDDSEESFELRPQK